MYPTQPIKSKPQLNQEIFYLLELIYENHPELSKYLLELPLAAPQEKYQGISNIHLLSYRNTLAHLIKTKTPEPK